MTESKPATPTARLGIYKQLDAVPESLRLGSYADRYDGTDIWSTWADQATATHTSQRYTTHVDRTARTWKQHMADRGRHHALARPLDIETWAETILDRCQPLSAYQIYFTKLEAFYEWLRYHPDHVHCYNPVLMAAAQHDAVATIWAAKIARREC
ncbi:hypothetical protein HZS55_22145 [Halosimplex rubrum]|uniref:Site-specific integrase n=1 Tax=Halosimplex rubrum TaxID=869889 RepID=A0A7D5T6V9_9EURY|nr:hypothetical protein [Halosimplex rubrum]QLH79830.1 hypothetical protein HZS55_22145 [Halosimplex rubrum]